jgi:hypothetical protein
VWRAAECLDHIIVSGEAPLRRILISYAAYDNSVRTHRSLHKDAPISRPIQQIGIIRSHLILGGLHHITSGFEFSVHTGSRGTSGDTILRHVLEHRATLRRHQYRRTETGRYRNLVQFFQFGGSSRAALGTATPI